MMKFHLLMCAICLLTVPCPSEVSAQSTHKSSEGAFFELDNIKRKKKPVVCKVRSNGRTTPGFLKKGKFTAYNSKFIRKLTSRLRLRFGSLSTEDLNKKVKKKKRNLKALFRSYKTACTEQSEKTPTKDGDNPNTPDGSDPNNPNPDDTIPEGPQIIEVESYTFRATAGRRSSIALETSKNTTKQEATFTIDTTETEGSAVVREDGVVLYTPPESGGDEDTFTYYAENSRARSEVATVSIRIVQVGTEFRGDPDSLAKYSDEISLSEANHLLDKVAMGGNPELLRLSQTGSLDELVDRLVDCEPGFDPAAYRQSVYNDLKHHWYLLVQDLDGDNLAETAYYAQDPKKQRWNRNMFAHAFTKMLIESPCPLEPVLAQFIHDLVPVAVNLHDDPDNGTTRGTEIQRIYLDNLMDVRTGGYEQFLRTVLEDPMMSIYLDNRYNTLTLSDGKGGENFPRELLELFTFGADAPPVVIGTRPDGSDRFLAGASNYEEHEMREIMHVVSGLEYIRKPEREEVLYTLVRTARFPGTDDAPQTYTRETSKPSIVRFNEAESLGPTKVFSGTPYEEPLGFYTYQHAPALLLYSSPELPNRTARRLAARLFGYFVHTKLTNEIIDFYADMLVGNQFDFRPVLKHMFKSQAMFSSRAHDDCLSSPLEFAVMLARKIDLPLLR